MNIPTKPLSEITQQAIALLSKEIGIVDIVRFLSQFTTGYGDYTAEREALFKDLTLDRDSICDEESAWATERLTVACSQIGTASRFPTADAWSLDAEVISENEGRDR